MPALSMLLTWGFREWLGDIPDTGRGWCLGAWTFLLTTNRPDLLGEALAARPGRVDHTARLPLPDAAARRRLLRLYQGNLHVGRSAAALLVDRTDGVTASFIKELLRRAALHAAVSTHGQPPHSPPPRAPPPAAV